MAATRVIGAVLGVALGVIAIYCAGSAGAGCAAALTRESHLDRGGDGTACERLLEVDLDDGLEVTAAL